MTLPFAKDDGKRKWQCFVCGKVFMEVDTFKEHITENHEEGREFILCPLERCGVPVRDLRAHFKAKHPTENNIPAGGLIKALVWKDQSMGKKGLKTRQPKFREGTMISNKNGGREFSYKSGMECEFLELLEADSDVLAFDYEPFSCKYLFEGESHSYFPDISIQFFDGHIEVWEIKPGNQTALPKNLAKWAACQDFCKVRGWGFQVMTERGLGLLKAKIRKEKAE